VIRKLTVLEILFLINVMVKAMTAAVTFHPHLHHIPKKKNQIRLVDSLIDRVEDD
jgi:hypothetical protein